MLPSVGLSFDLSPSVGPLALGRLSKRRICATGTPTRSDSQTKSDVRPHRPQVTHAKTGFLPSMLKPQKGQEALNIFLNYFRSFLAFTAQSTMLFHWSKNILSFVRVVQAMKKCTAHSETFFFFWFEIPFSFMLFLFLSLRTAEYFMEKLGCS